MTRYKSFLAVLFFGLFISFNASADIIIDEVYDFSLDIPEGYELQEISEDYNTYSFQHPDFPVSLILKVISNEKMYSSYSALSETLNKLKAERQIDSTIWNDTSCSIASFNFTLDKKYTGWSVAAPLQRDNTFVVLLCYSPDNNYDQCNQFIFSTLNSLCTNADYYNKPGIITSYAYPSLGTENNQISIGSKIINFKMDKVDVEASEFLIDMEYSVLLFYAKHALWKEAWQRYYRMIYRDNFGRLEDFSTKVINSIYSEGEKIYPDHPDLYFAQTILSWVQGFKYERLQNKNSDLTSPCAAVKGAGNDCDCRSLLVTILTRSLGLESILLISREYSHAMAAVEIDAPGQKYIPAGTDREFIMGETTAPVTWGKIAADMQDREKWIPVYLP